MPAVEPTRLDQEIRAILSHLEDPPRLTSELLDRLEFYSDRARADSAIGSEGAAFRTSAPVLRTLQRRLVAACSLKPQATLPAAEALWQAGWREARLLAASLLQTMQSPQVPRLVQAWATEESRDPAVSQALAEIGLQGWRRADPARFYRQVKSWLRARSDPKRTLGLRALHAAIEDSAVVDVPSALRAIAGLNERVRGDSRRALVELYASLARRSPAESARFLLDELDRDPRGMERIIRAVSEAFPARQRALLQDRLSAHRRAGIMRRG